MTTAIEWAIQNPTYAVDFLLLTALWLLLAVPGTWVWMEKGILPMRERWRSNWRHWPRLNWIEAVAVTIFGALLWLGWLRIYLTLIGV